MKKIPIEVKFQKSNGELFKVKAFKIIQEPIKINFKKRRKTKMGFTIRKIKVTKYTESKAAKMGTLFYRVSSNGVYVKDFKTKFKALSYVKKLKK